MESKHLKNNVVMDHYMITFVIQTTFRDISKSFLTVDYVKSYCWLNSVCKGVQIVPEAIKISHANYPRKAQAELTSQSIFLIHLLGT